MTNVRLNRKLWTAAFLTVAAALLVTLSQAEWVGADGTEGTGPQQEPSVSFQDQQSQPIDSAVLSAIGNSVVVNISGIQLDLAEADTLQVHITHDPTVTSVHSASCVGLFQGAFSPADAIELEQDAGSAFMCSLSQDVVGASGDLISFTLERVGNGSDAVGFISTGDFSTTLYDDGLLVPVESSDSFVLESNDSPTPTPDPTATPTVLPTATATQQSGGGGGGGGAPQPTATPTVQLAPPAQPEDVKTIAGDESVTVTWEPPLSDGSGPVVSYSVQVFGTTKFATIPATARTHTFTGLQNGEQVQIRIRASNFAGDGQYSPLLSVTPAGTPGQPGNVNAVVAGTTISISWDEPAGNDSPITGYTVTEVDGKLSSLEVEGTETTAAFEGVLPGEYIFTVTANNGAGTGDASDPTGQVSVVVPPPVVGAPTEPPTATAQPTATPTVMPLQGPTLQLPNQTSNQLVDAFKTNLGDSIQSAGNEIGLRMAGQGIQLVLPISTDTLANLSPLNVNFETEQLSLSASGTATDITLSLGEHLKLSGNGTLGLSAQRVVLDLMNAKLLYEPEPPDSAAGGAPTEGKSVRFESDLLALVASPEFQASYFTSLYSLDESLRQALMDTFAAQDLRLTPAVDGVALMVDVEKNGLANEQLGLTTVTFVVTGEWAQDTVATGGKPYIVKIGDSGEVFIELAGCAATAGGVWECSVEFDGEAAGFSTFGLFSLSPNDEDPGGAIETVVPSPVPTPLDPTPTRTVPATEEPQLDVSPTPLPVPTQLAPGGNGTDGGGTSAAVIAALTAVGVVVIGLLLVGGYRYRHLLTRTAAGLIISIAVVASMIIVIEDGQQDAKAVEGVVTAAPARDVIPELYVLPAPVGADGYVVIDAVGDNPAALMSELLSIGLINGSVYRNVVSGRVPAAALDQLDNLQHARQAGVSRVVLSAGNVTSQGDAAIRADIARADHGFDGTDVRIGIISDSFDCLGGAESDSINGDLPSLLEFGFESPRAIIRLDQEDCPVATDEGRALMQIIHDVAPGADLYFYSGVFGQAAMANAITELGESDVSVIIDDILYLNEPYFQDGIIAQAVDEVVDSGAVYIAAAGNYGSQSYESEFRAGDSLAPGAFSATQPSYEFLGGTPHDFDPDVSSTDILQSVQVPTGDFLLGLQWDEPAISAGGGDGSASQVDAYLLDETGTTVIAAFVENTVGEDPLQVLGFSNPGAEFTANLAIIQRSGPMPGRIKYVDFSATAITLNEYATSSSTIVGHTNAAGAITVGAAFYADTPEFGQGPPLVQPWSSHGGTPILFSADGIRIPSQTRQKPDLIGPDGVNTTFFGVDINDDVDINPNIFGTSAAAAHVAGAIALVVESNGILSPDTIREILTLTAVDMDTAGHDSQTGFGLVDTHAAITEAIDPARDRSFLIHQTVNDIAHDPVSGRTFATVPSEADSFADSIVLIDPVTGDVTSYIAFAQDENPNVLEISDDGTIMHVGLDRDDGPGAIQQVDLVNDVLITGAPGGLIELGFTPDSSSNPLVAEDIEILPGAGNEKTIAVSLMIPRQSPRHNAVAIYDDGNMRPNRSTDPGDNPAHDIEFTANGTEIIGANRDVFPSMLTRMGVDADGIFMISNNEDTNATAEFELFEGLLYFESGQIVDPITLEEVYRFETGELSWATYNIFEDSRRIAFTANVSSFFPDQLIVFDLDSRERIATLDYSQNRVAQPTNFTQVGVGSFLVSDYSPHSLSTVVVSVRTGSVDPNVPGLHLGPDALAFSALVGDTSAAQAATLTNVTGVPLTISAVLDDGDLSDQFSIASDTCTGVSLAPDESCSVGITFSPTFRHETMATISIVSDAFGSPHEIELIGLAVETIEVEEQFRIHVPLVDLEPSPNRDVFYASVEDEYPTFGKSVVQIDPVTGLIHSPLFIGNEIGPLALSDDGTTLYVGYFDGISGAVVRINVANWQIDQTIPLGLDEDLERPLTVYDLEVQSGSSSTIAVLRLEESNSKASVAIFDDDVQRSVTSDDNDTGDVIEFIDSDTLFAVDLNGGVTPQLIEVTASGAAITLEGPRQSKGQIGSNVAIRIRDGLIYLSTGHIYDPDTLDVVGNVDPEIYAAPLIPPAVLELGVDKVFLPSPASNAVPSALNTWDFDTHTFVGTTDLHRTTRTKDLYRWGADGLIYFDWWDDPDFDLFPHVQISRSAFAADGREVSTTVDLQHIDGLIDGVQLLADPLSGSPVNLAVSDPVQSQSVPIDTYDFGLSAPGFISRELSGVIVGPLNADLPATQLLLGDADEDGAIDTPDLSLAAGAFGNDVTDRRNGANQLVDLNADDIVNAQDASIVSGNLGIAGPMGWTDLVPDPVPDVPPTPGPTPTPVALVSVESDPVFVGPNIPGVGDSETHVVTELAGSRWAPGAPNPFTKTSVFRVKRVIFPGDGVNPPVIEIWRFSSGNPRDITFSYFTDGLVTVISPLPEPTGGLRSVESVGTVDDGSGSGDGYSVLSVDGTDVTEALTAWGDTATIVLADQPNSPLSGGVESLRLIDAVTGLPAADIAIASIFYNGDGANPPVLELVQIGPNPSSQIEVHYQSSWAIVQ